MVFKDPEQGRLRGREGTASFSQRRASDGPRRKSGSTVKIIEAAGSRRIWREKNG